MANNPEHGIQKWVFSLDQRAENWFKDCIKVAVTSAKMYTSLQPICLFDGKANSELVKWLEDAGVTVILHEVSFKSELFSAAVMSANAGTHYEPDHAAGAYLRVEAARIIDDPYFLYTDCDIMFVGNPADRFIEPDLFAASPEVVMGGAYHGETQSFNSGVMIFNRENFRAAEESFIDFCREQKFYDRKHHSYDQAHLNNFFRGKWSKLSPALNWRPFQGVSDEMRIIHFHGPKPHRIAKILNGEASQVEMDAMKGLIDNNRAEYEYFVDRFNNILTK
jgi:hypothetical protein